MISKLFRILILSVLFINLTGTKPGLAGSARDGEPPLTGQASAGDPGPRQPATARWYDGNIKYSYITNCASIIMGTPYTEAGTGAYVGFRADLDTGQPTPNQVYYIHIVIVGLGNACSGQRVYPEIMLPTNTNFAFDALHPMYCYYDSTPTACPPTLYPSSFHPGAYSIPSGDNANANTWPLPQGRSLEFQIPVVSSTILTSANMIAYVKVLDGNSSPWLDPWQGVYVFGGSTTPVLMYHNPSADTITATTAKTYVDVYPVGLGGTVYFQIGQTAAYGEATATYSFPAGTPPQSVWVAWSGLQPDTIYHWRAYFTPTGQSSVYASDQTFRTLVDGLATVGSGAAASCTDAALNSAFAVANVKKIIFDCGTTPITITLTTSKYIGGNVTLDGNNKVVLKGSSSGPMFFVDSSFRLTLNNIDLVNGSNDAGCGGAVYLMNSAQLFSYQTRFLSNHANNGGAICGETGSYMYINRSLVRNNVALANGGGIISNGGTIELFESDVSNNSAGPTTNGSGGGIYSGGDLIMKRSLTVYNSAFTGGGIASAGNTTIETSTVAGNGAVDGAGIYHSGNNMFVYNSTVAWNYSTKSGRFYFTGVGGLYNTGSYAALKNTIVAYNSFNNCNTSPFILVFDSGGYNLDSDSTCKLTATGDLNNVDPRLVGLGLNGGPTRTIGLQASSPAINHADNTTCLASVTVDQRGMTRPIGNQCDIGAFEYKPTIYLPLVIKP